ncbi:hypothetical protein WDU94_004376 [Cyamophila willieti]
MSVCCIVTLNQTNIDKFSITESSILPLKRTSSATKLQGNALEVTEERSRWVKIISDGYSFSYIKNCLQMFPMYRRKVLEYYSKISPDTNWKIIVKLVDPQQHILDIKWAKIIDTMVVERRELDNSFSWMSTLGGAYSALGDYIPNYAIIAGKISVRQLELALHLGDTPVVIRCCLYYALSLIQQYKLHEARQVIHTQYVKAKQLPIEDTKLINICKGIWSRLQYEWSLRKKKRKEMEVILCR